MATDAVKKQKQIAEHTTSATVCVACKIPTGLQLQLQTPVPKFVDTKDGLEKVVFNVKGGKVYHVHGPAYPVQPPKGYPRPPVMAGGYAMTPGIPTKFWNDWLEQNKLADYVIAPDGAEHGMIFAYPTMEEAMAAAKEQERLLSGLEPLSTDVDKDGRLTDPRVPRPIGTGIQKLGPEPYPEGGATSISLPA